MKSTQLQVLQVMDRQDGNSSSYIQLFRSYPHTPLPYFDQNSIPFNNPWHEQSATPEPYNARMQYAPRCKERTKKKEEKKKGGKKDKDKARRQLSPLLIMAVSFSTPM